MIVSGFNAHYNQYHHCCCSVSLSLSLFGYVYIYICMFAKHVYAVTKQVTGRLLVDFSCDVARGWPVNHLFRAALGSTYG